ncbi:hypothetical protein QS306_00300 [Paraburkholderia bonniea]|uniref:hypothetical protein n=1 Tax=Paraburkholderia bonniea TaxID=2152891 RepID=UPI001291E36F|nr:hypothetical protein [Paraburkholderia bonniea]WJF90173.1 hypothetical protein QS306_00300 [Paraburkholderia bonniea]WJF93487.1 hypothetical protein QS308_00300 [Paraburkholderia bonniea]
MNTFFTSRLTRAAFQATRPSRGRVVRALRHHVARARALAAQWREMHAANSGVRAWFRRFFSALRLPGNSRQFLPRALFRRPAMLRRPVALPARLPGMGRRPRRMSPASADWFAFSGR